MTAVAAVRPSPIAGTWYSGKAEVLARQVDGWMDQAMLPPLEGAVIGVMAPHAGHRYSGRTAAHAFRAVRGQTRPLVVILSPYHAWSQAALLTTAHAAYQTPLGQVRVDVDGLAQVDEGLAERRQPVLRRVAFDEEHSLEIELPFLQRALSGDFRLLPLMVRSQDWNFLSALADVLAHVLRNQPDALLVASTDLSHFYPLSVAQQLDAEMLRRVAAFDPRAVLEAERSRVGFACGVGAVVTMLLAAQRLGADAAQVVHYSTSAEETDDVSSVVGYGAALVLKRG
ncbi:MAG: AmmeMemoRadiSam system protein B [Longilinea sp.]|nr:AmmeMemoRadiSam system protein B [Longilinea sp.]MCA1953813.1 AmmeMemoRadiSam system protein B [Anaerolinea sp.]